jgi:hypothetical protein
MTTLPSVRLRPAETAQALRATLKAAFPGVKFSVRTRTYAGGSSIDVSYFRGPASDRVSRVADRFNGRDFDGMTDSSTYRPPVLLCDESGAMREVDYGSSFVFVRRELDENRYGSTSPVNDACEAAIRARYAEGHAPSDLRAYRQQQATDWCPGESVESFAARIADAYFA